MGQIISSSLDSLVGYEDCDPTINASDSFFDILSIKYTGKKTTYYFVLFIYIIMVLLVTIYKDKLGFYQMALLIVLPWITFGLGTIIDSVQGIKDAWTTKNIWQWFDRGVGTVSPDHNKAAESWKGKWGFIGGLSPFIIFGLYIWLKFMILKVNMTYYYTL